MYMYIQCTFRRSGGFGFGQYVLFPAKLLAMSEYISLKYREAAETPVSQGIHIVQREKNRKKVHSNYSDLSIL